MNFSNISLRELIHILDFNNNLLSKQEFNDLQHNKIVRYYTYDNNNGKYVLHLRNNVPIKISIR